MPATLISEKLLKREIKRIKDDPELMEDELNAMWINLCEKELALIKHIKINEIDQRGTLEDFAKRINEQTLYFMEEEDFEVLKEKARRFDAIANIIEK